MHKPPHSKVAYKALYEETYKMYFAWSELARLYLAPGRLEDKERLEDAQIARQVAESARQRLESWGINTYIRPLDWPDSLISDDSEKVPREERSASPREELFANLERMVIAAPREALALLWVLATGSSDEEYRPSSDQLRSLCDHVPHAREVVDRHELAQAILQRSSLG